MYPVPFEDMWPVKLNGQNTRHTSLDQSNKVFLYDKTNHDFHKQLIQI